MDFRTLFLTILDNTNGALTTREMVSLTDTVLALFPNADTLTDEQRVLGHQPVLAALADGKKILAIKEVRGLLNCGLKDAKDLVDKIVAEKPSLYDTNRTRTLYDPLTNRY